uniref:Uncharacterized protein n=1 Tax=Chaetoceros debilis TaxID=122233 RepID=A0A7S3PUH0_9STRA
MRTGDLVPAVNTSSTFTTMDTMQSSHTGSAEDIMMEARILKAKMKNRRSILNQVQDGVIRRKSSKEEKEENWEKFVEASSVEGESRQDEDGNSKRPPDLPKAKTVEKMTTVTSPIPSSSIHNLKNHMNDLTLSARSISRKRERKEAAEQRLKGLFAAASLVPMRSDEASYHFPSTGNGGIAISSSASITSASIASASIASASITTVETRKSAESLIEVAIPGTASSADVGDAGSRSLPCGSTKTESLSESSSDVRRQLFDNDENQENIPEKKTLKEKGIVENNDISVENNGMSVENNKNILRPIPIRFNASNSSNMNKQNKTEDVSVPVKVDPIVLTKNERDVADEEASNKNVDVMKSISEQMNIQVYDNFYVFTV